MTRKSSQRILLAVEPEHPSVDFAIVLAEDWAREVGGELLVLVVPADGQQALEWPEARATVAKRVELVSGRGASRLKMLWWTNGRPARVILAAAESHRVDRVVVALRAQSRWSGILKVHVIDDLLRTAIQPVLVARATKQSGSVLVAADLSAASDAVLSSAAAEAARRGVCLSVLHCFQHPEPTGRVRTHPLDEDVAGVLLDPRVRFRKRAAVRVAEIAQREGVPNIDLLFAEGDVSRSILEMTGRLQPELVVVGARRPPQRHLFRRGTAARIARQAPCPVLVVPEPHQGGSQRAGGERPGSSYTAGQS
jgi:nucleotide-binding universal stress UspA family protein